MAAIPSGIAQKLGQPVSTGNFEFFGRFGDGEPFGRASFVEPLKLAMARGVGTIEASTG
jgi:hypothetical protein